MDEKKKAEEAAAAAKVIADAAAVEEAKVKADEDAKATMEAVTAPLTAKDAEIAKLSSDLANYKNVALKRLGKLPGDADFVAGIDEKTGLTVEETVRKTLLEQKLITADEEKNSIVTKVLKENAELRLAIKNRPSTGLGGEGSGGSGPEVKDNVFSEAQLTALRARATVLKLDPEKYIEKAKANIQSRSR